MFLPYLGLLVIPLVLFAGQAAYNLFLHPLRNYPGPSYATAFKWPWYWHRVRGTQATWTAELHRRYGHVVRVAPDHLSYTNVDAWKDIYGHRTSAGRGNLPKDLRLYTPPSVGRNSILTADDAVHARVRRSIAHAFSDKALAEQEPLIRRHIDLFVEKLRDAASVPGGESAVDIVRFLQFITFDIMTDMTLGQSLGLLERSDFVPWVAGALSAVKFIGVVGTLQSISPLLMPLITRTVLRGMKEKRAAHAQFTKEHVDMRLARDTTRPDIWTFVLRNTAKDAAKGGLDRDEMHANASALIAAGTETTATLISGACWLLCTNKDKLTKLNEEVREAARLEGYPGMHVLTRLPYLNACLQEALRVYPPAPNGLPRITPPEGAVICGKPVAGKTTVYVSHYAAYHSEANFFDPRSFRPERWLPDPDECFSNDQRNVLEPFSFGPRNCVGKNLAWHEMRAILANLVLNFDMILDERTDKHWIDQTSSLVWDKKRLLLKLKPSRANLNTQTGIL
ncbi:benzoate 4-monooxygenase cytochrome P450 [Macrophomina phaseolina]|uniref:Benzoate 4-monooxygenase cytochrome P450 n=1 Tax=Macrophomina phaseolina TaxID=35725 RepID=A0ABQ8G5D7_9PEZI|nr:benzoate 4-monooxygenase cytochrome P450 [Macrophomina phaseolina]